MLRSRLGKYNHRSYRRLQGKQCLTNEHMPHVTTFQKLFLGRFAYY